MPGHTKRNAPAVFLGNLRTDIRISLLKDNIATLFGLINIDYIRKNHISVIKRPYATFCFVALGTKEEAEAAVAKFNKLLNRGGIPSDLWNNLIEPGLSFKVGLKTDFGDKSSAVDNRYLETADGDSSEEFIDDIDPNYRELRQHNNAAAYDNEDDYESRHLARTGTRPVSEKKKKVAASGYQTQQYDNTAAYDNEDDYEAHRLATTGAARPVSFGKKKAIPGGHQENYHKEPQYGGVGGAKGPLSAVQKQVPGGAYSDSSLLLKPGVGGLVNAKPQVKKYIVGQKLGNETRNVEYKCGQGQYKDKHFFRHVAVYMSAFLNSDGGTLLIGVDDDGIVQGLQLSHKEEDSLRTKIDVTIKDMRPDVFPRTYSVHFVPVFDNIGKILKELKVIEIKIKRGDSSQLYQTGKGEVYIRRDGSVQELSASAIQEYTRIRVLQELERKGLEMKNLEKQDTDLKDQLVVLQQQLADIRIQMNESENQRLQSVQTETDREQLRQEVHKLSEKLATVKRDKSKEKEEQRKMRSELDELRREKREWQEKGLKRNKSKTCTLS